LGFIGCTHVQRWRDRRLSRAGTIGGYLRPEALRGIEARTLLDAMNTDHDWTLTSIHASSTEGALRRIAAPAVRAAGQMTIRDAEEEVQSSINIVLQLGQRIVSDILET